MVQERSELMESWTFTADTSTTKGWTGVPLSADSFKLCEGGVTVGWGDGETTFLDRNSPRQVFAHWYYDGKPKHQVVLACEMWGKVYLETLDVVTVTTTYSGRVAWERSLVSVDEPLPRLGGVIDTRIYIYKDEAIMHLMTPSSLRAPSHPNDIPPENEYTVKMTKIEKIEKKDFGSGTYLATVVNRRELRPDCLCGVFARCERLERIPEDIFVNNPLATDFSEVFLCCENLRNISRNLFRGNPRACIFDRAFAFCPAFTGIPSGLTILKGNTPETDFEYIKRLDVAYREWVKNTFNVKAI